MADRSLAELLAERERIDAELQGVLGRSNATFGHNLRALREARDWTQEDLADRIGLGRSSVANMEAGRQATPWPTLCLLADVFAVSLDVFRAEPVAVSSRPETTPTEDKR